ncbi:MAG: cytochrome b N-terminal domain-containing protein [Pirellulaceae bacterium]
MKKIIHWLVNWTDERTGVRDAIQEGLYENIPGGSRWRYITGSMLVFAFMTQVVTGIFLWMSYSAGTQNAWASVYYIQNVMPGGWLLRGIHHVMAQAMVVLMPVHMLQVIIAKAYQKPREINFWLGLVLMLITLGLGLTGYLLPWDQKGYWATKVATELAALPPVVGDEMQRVVVGGSDYGHHTLTRFFALHAGVLPALMVIVLGLHIAMFRRHGITAESSDRRPDEYFWPKQVAKDAIGCLILLALVVGVVVAEGGAELGAPAEPTEEYNAARPEWYFLFLFQALKLFHSEFVGAIVVPGLVVTFLFLMPVIAHWKYGHRLNVAFMVGLLTAVGVLTYMALRQDNYATWYPDAPRSDQRVKDSLGYLEAKKSGHREYERIKELIRYKGIPLEGPNKLQQEDPETMGPRIFRRLCASCHAWKNEQGEGIAGPSLSEFKPGDPPIGAPNLYGFASRQWLEKLLDPEKIASHDYFGATRHVEGQMVEYVTGELPDYIKGDQGKADLKTVVAALSAEAGLVDQVELDAADQKSGLLQRGRELISGDFGCINCHTFGEEEVGGAPSLTGYGSATWLRKMISDPNHAELYGYEEGANDRMPAFFQTLTDHQVEMLVRWLRGDDKDLARKLELERSAAPAALAP